MAIGKPLLVSERKGVAQPVLSAQTQQLSSNVPVQKIAMADYSIGMNNATSSFAVSRELANMVDAGVKAKMYIDQTKQQYARLNLMESWNENDNKFDLEFAKAMTPEEQEDVINRYGASIQNLTDNYRKGGGLGLPTSDSIQAQRDLTSLRTQSQNKFSKMHTTMAANINNRTGMMLEARSKTLMREAIQNKNADPISIINDLKEISAQQIAIGRLLPEQAKFNLELNLDKMITGRANLFGTDLAKEAIASDRPIPPSETQVKENVEQIMNIQLDKRQTKLLTDAFNEAYYKELKAFNAEEQAEYQNGQIRSRELKAEYTAKYTESIQDGKLSNEEYKNLTKQAEAISTWDNGYATQKKAELEAFIYNAPSDIIAVESYTKGEKSAEIRQLLDPDGAGYYAPDKFSEATDFLTNQGYSLRTAVDILKTYKKENAEVDKNILSKGKFFLADLVKQEAESQTDLGRRLSHDYYDDLTGPDRLAWGTGYEQRLEGGPIGKIYTAMVFEMSNWEQNKAFAWSKDNKEKLSVEERLSLFKEQAQLAFKDKLVQYYKDKDAEVVKAKEKKEAEQRRKTGGFSQLRGADEVGGKTGIPRVIPEREPKKHPEVDLTILESDLMQNKFDKVITEHLPALTKQYFSYLLSDKRSEELGYKGDLNVRKSHLKEMADMSKKIEDSYVGIFFNGLNEVLSGAGGQMKEDAEAVYNWGMEGLANFISKKLHIGMQKAEPDTSNEIFTGGQDLDAEFGRTPTKPMGGTTQMQSVPVAQTPEEGVLPAYAPPTPPPQQQSGDKMMMPQPTIPPVPPESIVRTEVVEPVAKVLKPAVEAIQRETGVNLPQEAQAVLSALNKPTPDVPGPVQQSPDAVVPNTQPVVAEADQGLVDTPKPVTPTIDQAEIDLNNKYKELERNTARWERTIELSQRAGWPMRGTKEAEAIQKQIAQEFPDEVQLQGKGLSEPIDHSMTLTKSPKPTTVPSELERNMIGSVLAKKYNASEKSQQLDYAKNASESIRRYYANELTPEEKQNVQEMISTLDQYKSSFIGDLKYLNIPYDVFIDHMIGIYGAETLFGTYRREGQNKKKGHVSETGVVGELQVTRGTFRDVVKPKGNFGKLMAKALGFDIKQIRELAKYEKDKKTKKPTAQSIKNDKKLRYLLLNSKKFNYLAGVAVLLNKMQYTKKK